MSTEIAVRAATLPEKMQYAEALAYSGMLPEQYRKTPANVLWAIEYGETIGISAMAAITGVHLIEGKPTASSGLISGLVRRAGHRLRSGYDAATRTGWAEIVRFDDPEFTFRSEWNLDRAIEAELVERGPNGTLIAKDSKGRSKPWKKFYPSMTKARAITEVARDACEEVLFGLHYTPEELGAETDDEGEILLPGVRRPARTVQADADPWMTAAPAAVPVQPTAPAADEIEDAEVVDDAPSASAVPAPPAHPEQVKRIAGGLKAVRGVTDKDEIRKAIGAIIGHSISAAADLTAVEADQVLNVLRAESEQKQQAAAAPAGPAPVGSPSNPVATEVDQKMMNGLLNKANYGRREDALWLISRILRRPVTTRAGMPRADARTVIAAVNRILESGEMPPPWEPPAVEQSGPAPSDEGIAEFDVLLQMIDDVRPDDEASFGETQRAIEDEFQRGRINQTQVETLRGRLADQVTAVAA